jgi:malate dehydrogenase (oxaloacetate-decarboxylating)(NADP+)
MLPEPGAIIAHRARIVIRGLHLDLRPSHGNRHRRPPMTADRPPLSAAEEALRDAALDYHRAPTRGKVAVMPTKPLANQRDLSLAYSPGVAYACLEIQRDPTLAADFTSRGNLVGVITNGTAVLGLGDIGPLAGKPVMEGKGCLFKKFAGIDVFDIELAEKDPDRLVEIIAALEPTLGGINLEDIKAPECFEVERKLRERLSIPVFHDDQHGTAIISAAALLNGLELVGKSLGEVKVAVSGAGAAAIACLDVFVGLGVRREHIFVCDSRGVVHAGREGLDPSKQRYAQPTDARTLADVVRGADVFLGCSAPGVLTPAMVETMGRQPIILALANPEPEIRPELAKAARPDCIIATGRSDYPNQVNNVLCFPYIFRGALDAGATRITEEMKLACVRQIAELAKAEVSDEVAAAYAGQELSFGPDYLIPKPFDSRLILRIAPAVARAAADSGVAARPIADLDAYQRSLTRFVTHTGLFMSPVFATARAHPARVAYAEGEDERVLRAAQNAIDEGLARPILVGRPAVIETRLARAGLRIRPGRDFELVDPEDDARFRDYWSDYRQLMGRRGVTPELAKTTVRRSATTIAAMMVRRGDADAMVCGMVGRFDDHLARVRDVIGLAPGASIYAAMNALMLPEHTLFVTDTLVNDEPTAAQLAEIARLAVDGMRAFRLPPKVAFVSHSMFGSSDRPGARRVREAAALFAAAHPGLECDGEMHGDAALSEDIRRAFLPESTLTGSANLLVLPNLDAANILFNVLKVTGGKGITVGPILLGAARPVHILTPAATTRRVLNVTALAVAQAAARSETG